MSSFDEAQFEQEDYEYAARQTPFDAGGGEPAGDGTFAALADRKAEADDVYGLSDVQRRAIDMTLRGYTDRGMSNLLRLDRKTLWRWKTGNEAYRRALAEGRLQIQATSMDQYQVLLSYAASALEKILLGGPDNKEHFSAARTVLCMAGAFRPAGGGGKTGSPLYSPSQGPVANEVKQIVADATQAAPQGAPVAQVIDGGAKAYEGNEEKGGGGV